MLITSFLGTPAAASSGTPCSLHKNLLQVSQLCSMYPREQKMLASLQVGRQEVVLVSSNWAFKKIVQLNCR